MGAILTEIKHKSSENLKETHTNKLNNTCSSWSLQHYSIKTIARLCVAHATTLPWKTMDRNKSGHNYTLIDHEKQVVPSAARLVVVAQPDVIQLCKNTLQMSTACPKFRMCAGSEGPRLLLEVSVGGVAPEFIALNDVNLGPRACKLLTSFHKSTPFKTVDRRTRTPFRWILLDFF